MWPCLWTYVKSGLPDITCRAKSQCIIVSSYNRYLAKLQTISKENHRENKAQMRPSTLHHPIHRHIATYLFNICLNIAYELVTSMLCMHMVDMSEYKYKINRTYASDCTHVACMRTNNACFPYNVQQLKMLIYSLAKKRLVLLKFL